MKKILLNILAVVTLLAAVPAFADWGPGPGYPPPPPPPGWGPGPGPGYPPPPPPRYNWRCEQAQQRLAQAQQNTQQAWAMVLNNPQICPGGWERNAGCMQMLANNYNNAKIAEQQAQEEVNRACYWRRW